MRGVNAQVVTGTVLLTGQARSPGVTTARETLREFTPSGWATRGAINYLSGDVALTFLTAGTDNAITRASCVTTAVGET